MAFVSAFKVNFTAPNSDGYPGGSQILDRLAANIGSAFKRLERLVGLPNGIAPLGSDGMVPVDFLAHAAEVTLPPSSLMVSSTAAVNTALTATLPAVSGQFHYITQIELVKLYSVIGIANGAGVIVTSTNLPGNPAWTTEQLASAAGTTARVITLSFGSSPLKSLASGVATTLVAPAELQTIWRWNITYYTA